MVRAQFAIVVATALALTAAACVQAVRAQDTSQNASQDTSQDPNQANEATAAGLWQAVDANTHQPTGWFLVRKIDGDYVGVLAKMFLKPDQDPNVVCGHCSGDRHDKPWLGLEIIRGMKRDGRQYSGGTILDPRDGDVYDAMMSLSPDGQTLTVRGYLGISLLGRNQYWTRLPNTALNQLDPSIYSGFAAKPENSAGNVSP